MRISLILFLMSSLTHLATAQKATIKEELINMKTYMFSDPNPIADISRIYPYFRFDGYTNEGKNLNWQMIVLENDYLKVYVCPKIGGKVWGAIEKSTGKEFLYFNHTVKFRDVAMRGAWTSGGLEYNFGDIGHIPTCATPIDYILKNNEDGSVSCVVGAIDLPSRTQWNVEIMLPADKAYFETKASWFNNSPLPVTYYHWMNAAAKSSGNLEFIYPGNKRIGHGGELGDWPKDGGRDLPFYDNNDFGIYKSYHIINAYSDFFGGYWHDDDFGFGHFSSFDDKPGKKIWIWGLSDQGMIWKDLLTDTDDQYIEYQSGKLFNQAANSSTFTPFKHREFSAGDADVMRELWFPLKATKGMDAASEYAVLKVFRNGNKVELIVSALQKIQAKIGVTSLGKTIASKTIHLQPLELDEFSFECNASEDFEVKIGDGLLYYSSDTDSRLVERPTEINPAIDWASAYGLYTQGLELEKQRRYPEAMAMYRKSLKVDPAFLPSLNRMALGYYRKMDYDTSLIYTLQSLAVDTYDPLANYVFGLVNKQMDKLAEAKSGFSIACQSTAYRSASYTKLAEIFLKEQKFTTAKDYCLKALTFNANDLTAIEMLALLARKESNLKEANVWLTKLNDLDAVNPFLLAESINWQQDDKEALIRQITNELPFESFLELAIKYYNFGCQKEAKNVLETSPEHPIVLFWLAYLDKKNTDLYLQKALAHSAKMVFPHRKETLDILEYFQRTNNDWKLKYYTGLIYWNKGEIEKARQLFSQCGTEPDYEHFYLAKIQLFSGERNDELACLKKARSLNPTDWRINLAWINRHLADKNFNSAERLAKAQLDKHPEKSIFGMRYAKALLAQKAYEKCISFLENFNILPYEGATEGRNMYHETCIQKSFNELEKNNFSEAIKYAEKAKLWPKNLGVGKPYDVDERLDNFLIAYAYEKQGMATEAKEFYSKVMNHKTPSYLNENSKLVFQVMVLRKFNREKEALALIQESLENYPRNEYIKWVNKAFSTSNAGELVTRILNNQITVQAYDTKFVDHEFLLVLNLFDGLHIE